MLTWQRRGFMLGAKRWRDGMTNEQAMKAIRDHGHQAREQNGKVEAGIRWIDSATGEQGMDYEQLGYSGGLPTVSSLRNILGY